jgi:hypothetical protein
MKRSILIMILIIKSEDTLSTYGKWRKTDGRTDGQADGRTDRANEFNRAYNFILE